MVTHLRDFVLGETADPLARDPGLYLSQEQSWRSLGGGRDPPEEYVLINRKTSSEAGMREA